MQVKIHLDLSRATGPAPFTVATLDGELRVLLVNLARLPFPCLLRDRRPGEPIKHLVVIFQENETFDHYFGTYPDALNPPGPPGARFTPRPPPSEDVAAYVSESISSALYRYQAAILMHAPLEAVAQRSSPAAGPARGRRPGHLHPAHRVQLTRRARPLRRRQGLRLRGPAPARAHPGPAPCPTACATLPTPHHWVRWPCCAPGR